MNSIDSILGQIRTESLDAGFEAKMAESEHCQFGFTSEYVRYLYAKCFYSLIVDKGQKLECPFTGETIVYDEEHLLLQKDVIQRLLSCPNLLPVFRSDVGGCISWAQEDFCADKLAPNRNWTNDFEDVVKLFRLGLATGSVKLFPEVGPWDNFPNQQSYVRIVTD